MKKKLLSLAGLSIIAGAITATASSHREAPMIAEDQFADNTDVYAFLSPSDPNKLVMVANYIPLLLPQLVVTVPSYVFLEATLAVLGLGDPVLPTWGKVIDEARFNGAVYNGYYYWILEPAILLMFAGLGFSMLGFALDRVFNPRLREM